MIKAKNLKITEFRGIRNLELDLGGQNFAVCGPNGTGKSGVVDALEFALTGNISRLSGSGTGGLTVKQHGPHVNYKDDPEKASVTLVVTIPSLGKTATIHRTVQDAKNPTITPATPDIIEVLRLVSIHPEFVLSRRELIRYVLQEPGKRAKEVQELLRLDEVDHLRALFQKISNAAKKESANAKITQEGAGAALRLALVIDELKSAKLLEAVNAKRSLLSLPTIPTFESTTSIKDGLSTASAVSVNKISKADASSTIVELQKELVKLQGIEFSAKLSAIRTSLEELINDDEFLQATDRESLLSIALKMFNDETCPVCDTSWNSKDFKKHIQEKLDSCSAAVKKREVIEQLLVPVIKQISDFSRLLNNALSYGKLLNPVIDCSLGYEFVNTLKDCNVKLDAFFPIKESCESLTLCNQLPAAVLEILEKITIAINALPEPSAQDAARDYLVIGQEKLDQYRQAQSSAKVAEIKAKKSLAISDLYGEKTTLALEAIYDEVQELFSSLYRIINQDDEPSFTAKLTPTSGKLGLDVDFYGKGQFPPGAYHSEGHQDGMGLCLYLALMSHLSGNSFTFAVLDDVLMSVDSGHRREVSKMLVDKFPDTQFILTTHDEVWLKHMKTVGLIKAANFAHFKTWNVEIGPAEWNSADVWSEIDIHLAKGEVGKAAAQLRNHLEYFSKEACHSLRASVEFRGDGQYSLGQLLPPALSKFKKLLAASKKSAETWKQQASIDALTAKQAAFETIAAASRAEEWSLNASVHYNEWSNLTSADFTQVVSTFRALISELTCASCGSGLYVSPSFGTSETLRCTCTAHNYNLIPKK